MAHQGFVILENVVEPALLKSLQQSVDAISFDKAGTRNLLEADWCKSSAQAAFYAQLSFARKCKSCAMQLLQQVVQ